MSKRIVIPADKMPSAYKAKRAIEKASAASTGALDPVAALRRADICISMGRYTEAREVIRAAIAKAERGKA